MRGAMRAILITVGIVFVTVNTSCDLFKDSCDTVNVREVFLRAVAEPDRFDAALPTIELEGGTSRCLGSLSDEALAAEQNKLVECGQLVTESPSWEVCHEEAEAFHNNGVVLNDIKNAADGRVRFDDSSGGQFLILAKNALGPAEYEALIDLLQDTVPDLECQVCD